MISNSDDSGNTISDVTSTATGTTTPSGPDGNAGANTGSLTAITSNRWLGVTNAPTATAAIPAAAAGALFRARFDHGAIGRPPLAFASTPASATFASAINAQSAAGSEIWITFVCVDGSTCEAFASQPYRRSAIALTAVASVTQKLPRGQDVVHTLMLASGGRTINARTGMPVDGQRIEFQLIQSARTPTAPVWSAAFNMANSPLITWPSERTAASATWKKLYEWNSGTSKWERPAMV